MSRRSRFKPAKPSPNSGLQPNTTWRPRTASSIRGERADNLEQAIHHYEQALQVYTRETFPRSWAMTEGSLALALSERIRGERADNLEAGDPPFRASPSISILARPFLRTGRRPRTTWLSPFRSASGGNTPTISSRRSSVFEQALQILHPRGASGGLGTHAVQPGKHLL